MIRNIGRPATALASPLLLLLVLAPARPGGQAGRFTDPPAASGADGASSSRRCTLHAAVPAQRPALYEIRLKPTDRVPGAHGLVQLRPVVSPFGIAVTTDGHQRFDASLRAEGLPAPGSLGPYTTYVAWVAKSDLEGLRPLGPLQGTRNARGEIDLNKFMVFVSAEASADVSSPQGPVLLRGLSPSALLRNMLTEPLTNGGMPPC